MAKKDLSKRDRELLERLRAKGIGKKLARRIASAPDVDGKGGKRARKAAKKAVRRHEERWAEAEQEVIAVAEPQDAEGHEEPGAQDVEPAERPLVAGPAGGPLREAVEAAGALPHLGVGPGSDLAGPSSAEVPVVPTDQLPAHAGYGAQEGEQQGASAAIEEGTTDEDAGDDAPRGEAGEVAAETPPTGEGDRDEDLTSGLTAGGMDLGAVAPVDDGEGEGVTVDETVEAAEASAEDAEGGQEAQGGGDGEADVEPEAGGEASREAG